MMRRAGGSVVLPCSDMEGSREEYVRQKPYHSSADQW